MVSLWKSRVGGASERRIVLEVLFHPEGPRGKIPLPNSLRSKTTLLARSPSHLRGILRTGRLNKALQVGTSNGENRTVSSINFRTFYGKKKRDLGLPDVNAIKLPAMTSAIRSTIELSQGNPGPRALSTGNFRSAVGESSFSVTTLKYSNPCSFLANGDGPILTVAGDVHTEDSRHVTHAKHLEPVH